MSFFVVHQIVLTIVLSSSLSLADQPNIGLLQCFEYKRNYWLVGHAFHTSSVQFKDECLRLCLSSVLRGSRCLSAMHIPGDDQCVISNQNQMTRPDLFVENDANHAFTVNYFRNTCVDPPIDGGGRLEVHLKGFRGGQGLLEFVQLKGHNPLAMLVANGLQEDTAYSVVYSPNTEVSTCFRSHDVDGRVLLNVTTDNTGMAVQPWTELNFHILDDEFLDKVMLLVERDTSQVIHCGQLKIIGNVSDWENAKNTAFPTSKLLVSIVVVFFLFI